MSQRLTTGVIAQGKRVIDPLAGITGIVQRYRSTDIFTGIGNPVESWMNIGTQGGAATQAGVSEKPILEEDGVYADGVDAFLMIPSLAGLTQGSVFMLVKNEFDPGTTTSEGPVLGASGTDGGSNNHTPFEDGNIYDDFGSTSRKTVGNPSTSMTDWYILEFSSADNYWEAWFNGVSIFSTATNTVGFGASPNLFRDGAYYWAGWAKEILILDRASPTLGGDRATIRSYLNGLIT